MKLEVFAKYFAVAICLNPMVFAQSCAEFQTYQVLCSSGKTCSTIVNVSLPQSSPYGVIPYCGVAYCCGGGGHVASCQPGPPCEIAEMKDPTTNQHLREMASNYPLLIADCRGLYRTAESYFQPHLSDWSPAGIVGMDAQSTEINFKSMQAQDSGR